MDFNLLEYIDKGGIIVYILIFLNIIGFTIIIWKFLTIPRKNAMVKKFSNQMSSFVTYIHHIYLVNVYIVLYLLYVRLSQNLALSSS